MATSVSGELLYIGIDVGGTKIQASLVREPGDVMARKRAVTPRTGGASKVMVAVERLIDGLMREEKVTTDDVLAIGIAVPGVVDPELGRVVVTPNMSLTGAMLGPRLENRYKLPVALGNDCNLGALGENWLGAARGASSAFGVFVGTGIGGGFVRGNRLWCGYRQQAGEIGHMTISLGGPKCACGNLGCLEALASRTAIERRIRQAVAAGRKTLLTKLLGGKLGIIRSGALKEALARRDRLVTKVLSEASEVLGAACVSVFHVLDPEVIVLGGGVIEACGDFMLPIIQEVVRTRQLPAAREGGGVFLSALGDDAVVLGAVAEARMLVGRSPFKKKYASTPEYATVKVTSRGEISVSGKVSPGDAIIRVSGKVRPREQEHVRELYGTSHRIGTEEVAGVCKGGPEVLFVGTGRSARRELTAEAASYLRRRAIEVHVLPTGRAVEMYNRCARRKAALLERVG